jgi:hypothetical protein
VNFDGIEKGTFNCFFDFIESEFNELFQSVFFDDEFVIPAFDYSFFRDDFDSVDFPVVRATNFVDFLEHAIAFDVVEGFCVDDDDGERFVVIQLHQLN